MKSMYPLLRPSWRDTLKKIRDQPNGNALKNKAENGHTKNFKIHIGNAAFQDLSNSPFYNLLTYR